MLITGIGITKGTEVQMMPKQYGGDELTRWPALKLFPLKHGVLNSGKASGRRVRVR